MAGVGSTADSLSSTPPAARGGCGWGTGAEYDVGSLSSLPHRKASGILRGHDADTPTFSRAAAGNFSLGYGGGFGITIVAAIASGCAAGLTARYNAEVGWS